MASPAAEYCTCSFRIHVGTVLLARSLRLLAIGDYILLNLQAEREGEANMAAAMSEAAERLAEVQQEWQGVMENAHTKWGAEREALLEQMAQKEKDLQKEAAQKIQVRASQPACTSCDVSISCCILQAPMTVRHRPHGNPTAGTAVIVPLLHVPAYCLDANASSHICGRPFFGQRHCIARWHGYWCDRQRLQRPA